MGSLTSTLTFRLFDGVSGPARKVRGALQGVDRTAKATAAGHRGLGVFAPAAGGWAAMPGRMLGAAAGAYAVSAAAKHAFVSYAALDRRMTRVAITAEASSEAQKGALQQVRAIAKESALPTADVIAGLEALVAQGKSLPASLGFLPSVARTAQAAGAGVEDIARSAGALESSFGITAERMQDAFDILVGGGKLGQFELKDMAQYLPSIAASARAVGLRGDEGLRKTVAMLQVIRAQTGSSAEAATSMVNIFSKMESEETAKKFGKFGVDLRKEMAKARREGKDLLETFVDLSRSALKGDLSKLPQLFTDMEFQRGMRALLSQQGAVEKFVAELRKMGGATARDLARVSGDAQASVQNLSTAADNAATSVGKLLDAAGASKVLNNLSTEADGAADRLSKAASEGNALLGVLKEVVRYSPAGRLVRGAPAAWEEAKDLLPERQPVQQAVIDRLAAARRAKGQAVADLVTMPRAEMDAEAIAYAQAAIAKRIADADEAMRGLNETLQKLAMASPSAQGRPIEAAREAAAAAQAREDSRARIGTRGGRGFAARGKKRPGLPGKVFEVPQAERFPTEGTAYDPDSLLAPPAAPPPPKETHNERMVRLFGPRGVIRMGKNRSGPIRGVRTAPVDGADVAGMRDIGPRPDTLWRDPKQLMKPGHMPQMPSFFDAGGADLARDLDAVGAKVRALDGEMNDLFTPGDFSGAGRQAMQTFKAGLETGFAEAEGLVRQKMAALQALVSQPLRGNVSIAVASSGAGAQKIAPAPELPSRTAMHGRRGLLSDVPSYA